jgi:hypothetical protein
MADRFFDAFLAAPSLSRLVKALRRTTGANVGGNPTVVISNSDTTGRWGEIDALFHAALHVRADARDEFLGGACGGDADLRAEVERLIRLHESDDGFLETGTTGGLAHAVPFNPLADAEGRTIGSFKLVRQIGEGGMATVWLAKRNNASFQQRVALKVMRWGPVTANWRGRFASERQALAQLEHPYITRLIDGGTADTLGDSLDDLPFLVMEFVEGEPISRYCDTRSTGISSRVTSSSPETAIPSCWISASPNCSLRTRRPVTPPRRRSFAH